MKMYIHGMGAISPQKSWGEDTFLSTAFDHRGDALRCMEPDYETWIDPRLLRRMSRIIRMGVTSARMALKQAGVQVPDKIITGTGYGCLDDTGIFLSKMIDAKEQALNPTPFIQSTHNSIGSQVGLILQCLGYNQTYSHGALSFEHALLDASLHIDENAEQKILISGVDEITEISHAIQKRFGIFKSLPSSMNLFRSGRRSLNGEGAASFVVSGVSGEHDLAAIESQLMLHHVTELEIREQVAAFLADTGVEPADISFVLLGVCGDKRFDDSVFSLTSTLFPQSSKGYFKHLCGEYPSASSFALWLGANSLYRNHVPDSVIYQDKGRAVNSVLIYNPYFGSHHSFILLKSCREVL